MVIAVNTARKATNHSLVASLTRHSFSIFLSLRERERGAKNKEIQSNLGLVISLISKPNPDCFPDRRK